LTLSRLRAIRWKIVAPALFVIGSAVLFIVVGIPYERDLLMLWLMVGLFCFSITDMRGYFRGLIRDWLPFIAILIAYDALRGTAGRLGSVHYLPQIQVDRFLFGGQIPTVTLQRWLWHGHVVWYDVIPWFIYMTHFFASPILAAVLWKVNRERFRRFVVLIVAVSFAGLATYALYPAAPPWMATQRHLIAPITRIIPAVWHWLPLHGAGSVVEGGYQYANNVAAVPSLHAAFSLLVAITLWPQRRRWLRPLVAIYPLAMAFSVIYTGEHYFSDVLLGWIYTAVLVLAVREFAAWRSRSAVARSGLPQAVPGAAPAWQPDAG
jgi:membrane-associated phospholipid phosphatase